MKAPRGGSLSNWANLWSYDLLEWAIDQNIPWLFNRAQKVDRLIETEAATGKTLRTLLTRQRHASGLPIRITPDGRGLLMTLQDGDRLGLVSTASGRVIRTLAVGHWAATGSRWRQIAGIDDEGKTAYLVVLDESAERTRLLAWDLESGDSTLLLESGAERHKHWFRPTTIRPRRYFHIPGPRPGRFVEMPSLFREGSKRAVSLVWDLAADEVPPAHILTKGWSLSEPAFSSDGRRMYSYVRADRWFESGLTEFDLHRGKKSASVRLPVAPGGSTLSRIETVADRLIVEAHYEKPFGFLTGDFEKDVLLVYDMTDARWIGRYVLPRKWQCKQLSVSPDGRYLAVLAWGPARRGARRSVQELFVYDLTTLPTSQSGWEVAIQGPRGRHRRMMMLPIHLLALKGAR